MTVAVEFAPLRTAFAVRTAGVVSVLRSLGPYAAIELLLPGGSLLALVLWLYRRRRQVRIGIGVWR